MIYGESDSRSFQRPASVKGERAVFEIIVLNFRLYSQVALFQKVRNRVCVGGAVVMGGGQMAKAACIGNNAILVERPVIHFTL